MGSMWAALAHEPTYRPTKCRILEMSVNGLLTLGPNGLDGGSPSPRAHLSPTKIRILEMSVNGLLTSMLDGLDVGSPSPGAHLSPNKKSDIGNLGYWASEF